jgi:hypothetical protein
MEHLRRRQFVQGVGIAGLGMLAGCGRLPGQAQPPVKVYRLGYLAANSALVSAPTVEALQRGLRELAWSEGQNIVIESRRADGQLERLPELAARGGIGRLAERE